MYFAFCNDEVVIFELNTFELNFAPQELCFDLHGCFEGSIIRI